MGIPILIIGESGSGKTTSLRNFEPGEILVFSVANKPLSFRKKLDTVKNATYESIGAALKQKQYKRYAIDDSQYLMAFELFDRAKETGYGKFTDIAVRFRSRSTTSPGLCRMIRSFTCCITAKSQTAAKSRPRL